jgi:hypothetical protein
VFILVVEFLHGRHVSTSSRTSSGPNLRIQILHKLTYKMQVGLPVGYNVCVHISDGLCYLVLLHISIGLCYLVLLHIHCMCMYVYTYPMVYVIWFNFTYPMVYVIWFYFIYPTVYIIWFYFIYIVCVHISNGLCYLV